MRITPLLIKLDGTASVQRVCQNTKACDTLANNVRSYDTWLAVKNNGRYDGQLCWTMWVWTDHSRYHVYLVHIVCCFCRKMSNAALRCIPGRPTLASVGSQEAALAVACQISATWNYAIGWTKARCWRSHLHGTTIFWLSNIGLRLINTRADALSSHAVWGNLRQQVVPTLQLGSCLHHVLFVQQCLIQCHAQEHKKLLCFSCCPSTVMDSSCY